MNRLFQGMKEKGMIISKYVSTLAASVPLSRVEAKDCTVDGCRENSFKKIIKIISSWKVILGFTGKDFFWMFGRLPSFLSVRFL